MRSSRGSSALPSRVVSALPSAGVSIAGSAAGSTSNSPRGTALPPISNRRVQHGHVLGGEDGSILGSKGTGRSENEEGSRLADKDGLLPSIDTSRMSSHASSPHSRGSSVSSAASSARHGAPGTYKQKMAPTGVKDLKKDELPAGRRGREAAKEERERKKAEDEKKVADEIKRKRIIKEQQDEMRRLKEADSAVKAAVERREQGAQRLLDRTTASLAASKDLMKQVHSVHSSALEVAVQAAWSRLYDAAKDNNVELLAQLLNPTDEDSNSPRGMKRQKLPVGVCIPVDWASEELRGGGGNDRGYWSVKALDVNARGGAMQRTALHACAARGHLEAVRALCDDYGAEMDVADACGRCAVWWASKNGHLAVVLFLVDAGAQADIFDSVGNSPAHVAVSGGYSEILEVLVDAGANLLRRNNSGIMAKDMYGKHKQLASKLEGLGQLQRVTTDAPIHMSIWHDMGGAGLGLTYTHAGIGKDANAPQNALAAVEGLTANSKRDMHCMVRRNHPDSNYRLKQGHATMQTGFFLTCLVHAETGETQLLVSHDAFRTSHKVCAHIDMSSFSIWEIGAVHVTAAGSALVALRDGRILRTADMFESCAWVNPGAANGKAGDVLLSPPSSSDAQLPPPSSRATTPAQVPPNCNRDQTSETDFHAAHTWSGSKPGYAFKKDAKGLGYYLDGLSNNIWQPFAASHALTTGAAPPPQTSEYRASKVLGSFGAALLAIAAPDSNRVFVVGRAPREHAEAEEDTLFLRIKSLVQQLHYPENSLEPHHFLALALHMGHAKMTLAMAEVALHKCDSSSAEVATIYHFHQWHSRQVCH